MQNNGRLITLEGIDGCGKSTQASRLADWLGAKYGVDAVVRTFEPGDWNGGGDIRRVLLNSGGLSAKSELLLFIADRIEHVKRVIRPSLEENKWVICERFSDSTRAYQSNGRGILMRQIDSLFEWCEFPVPDLTIFLNVPVDVAVTRIESRGNKDCIEQAGIDFMSRLSAGFVALAEKEERIVTVDASVSVDEIAAEIVRVVGDRFGIES